MPAHLVRAKTDSGAEVSVGASYAKSHGLKVLAGKPAVDNAGRPIRPKYPVDLRGKELDAALDAAGLPKTGTAAEKRERLAERNQTFDATGVDETQPTPGGESATSEEDSK